TYTGVFDDIREVFASTNEAKVRGYKKGRFSFNVKGGRCEACRGDGIIKIEMHFLPDVYVPCEVCHGKRYNRETLEVTYKGKNIADILDMRVEEVLEFFENIPKIKRKIQTIVDVGLGYIKLGQSATTLSGGEAQRMKLATELHKRSNGKSIYILDEPTTGLNIADILDMRVEEAFEFFENILKIKRKIQTIVDVGLGYIILGQSATTLSGGEAQRMKLASELHKRSNGKSIYILDEPTTGLHVADIKRLLNVLERLVGNGDTVLIIEHNLDVIKTADYVIDMGPEGGSGGGELI